MKADGAISADDSLDSTEIETALRSHPLQLLADASSAFSEAALDPKRLVKIIARSLAHAIGDNCVIFLLDPEGQSLRAEAFVTRCAEQEAYIRDTFDRIPVPIGEGIMGKVAATREPVFVSDLDTSPLVDDIKPEYRTLYQKYPARSLIAVPLLARQRCLGVLALSRQGSRQPYSLDQFRLSRDLADRAAMAIEVSQLLERERTAAARATALADVSKAIQTLDLGEVISAIVRAGARLIGDACVLTLVEDGILRTKFAAHRDPTAEEHMRKVVAEPLPPGDNVVARAVRENRSVRVADAAPMQFQMRTVEQFKKEFGIASLLICPLCVEGKAIGTLGLSRGTGGTPYTGADEAFLQELADRAALVIHNARLYETARAARKEAETASMLKDQFLSAASHELRTPLTTIQLTLQGLLAFERKEAQSGANWSLAALTTAERETERLVHLVDDLLDVSRLAAGRLKFDVKELDLCELVRSVVNRFAAHADEARCPLVLVGPPSLRGSWDPNRIDQVLTNLLTNAIKFGRGHPITISVSELERLARISVADEGVGISAEDHERVFERFERAEPARNYRGVGVGLWVVRELVQAMGGSVKVESRLGEGATFFVEIPGTKSSSP
jgi:signal transduction histidine kinase